MCQNEKGSSEKNENKLAEKVVPHSNADHYNIFSDTIHSEKHCNSDLQNDNETTELLVKYTIQSSDSGNSINHLDKCNNYYNT